MSKEILVSAYNETYNYHKYFPLKKINRDNAIEDTSEFAIEKFDGDDDIIFNKSGENITNKLYENKISGELILKEKMWDINDCAYLNYDDIPEEVKEFIDRMSFDGNILLISTYLSEGLESIELNNVCIYKEKLFIELKRIPKEDGNLVSTYKVFLLIPKEFIKNINFSKTSYRYLP